MTIYDCTKDVKEHMRKVRYWMNDVSNHIRSRAEIHDKSKLGDIEKPIFDEYTPKLKQLIFGSDEYKNALSEMGEGLKHHYAENRHHPEHFDNGINGMTLIDLVEMFCDWCAVSEEKHTPINVDYLAQRFKIDPQLVDILINTMRDLDFWCDVNGVPVTYFTPENKRIIP